MLRRILILVVLGHLVHPSARAQDLEALRDSVRGIVRASRYATFSLVLAEMSADGQLSLGNLQIDDSSRTKLSILSFPWSKDFSADAKGRSLRCEIAGGYSQARAAVDDLWGGNLTGLETGVHTRFEALAVDAGIGPSLPLGSGYLVRSLAHVGFAHVENSTYFTGPGSTLTAALTDGILFNWKALYGSYGASLSFLQTDWVIDAVQVRPMLRYDLRQNEDLVVDDPALETSDLTHWCTARVDFSGPLGTAIAGGGLEWQLDVGYRRLFGESVDQMGFADFFELGMGLGWPVNDRLPLLSTIQLSGAIQYGEDVKGWSLGMKVSF